jgi:Plastocyanin
MKRKYNGVIVAVLIIAFIVTVPLMGCKKVIINPAATSAAETTGAGGLAVTIQSNSFNPASLTIKVGETVTWTNKDSYAHTVTSDNGAFDSGSINNGATFSFTFKTAGTYNYHCSIHTSMTAKIIVQ